MGNAVFRVVAPARMIDGMPDPLAVYPGSAATAAGDFRGVFSGAVVVGGMNVGSMWQGCSYTRPPFTQPGVGQIEPG